MPKPVVSLIASVARDGGIGRAGDLLVRLPGDLPRLKQLTMGSPIVMGRKTWDSFPRKPLPGRRNIVVSRDPAWRAEGAEHAPSVEAALAVAGDVPRIYVLGGAEIYAHALPLADELELTEIDAEFPADTFFPAWNQADFRKTSCEAHATPAGLAYRFATYRRITPGE